MSSALFNRLRESAASMGGCDPLWLKQGSTPTFQTFEADAPQGPEMVLLHGLFGALSNWRATIPLFAKYTRPIALQLPLLTGHRSEVRVKSLAVFTECFVRQQGIAPTILCGNSLGGHVAMRLYFAAPELVDCLILSGTSGLYEHSVDTLPIRPDARFVREHMLRVFYDPQFATEDAINEIAGILKARTNVLNLIHAARSAKKDNLAEYLPAIKCPTLLLWGEDDKVTTMDVAETFARLIPNSELITIKKCGHAPMIEHPEWFSENVEKFLRKNSKRFKAA